MGLPAARRLVLALGVLLMLPLTGCSDDASESPDIKVGDQVPGRVSDLKPGDDTAILTPAGRLTVSFADPVTSLEKDQTTDLTERSAPDGTTFVPVVWSFEDDKIYGELTRLFGDREPLNVDLVTGDETYSLIPPDSAAGKQAEYVLVKGDGKDLSLEVTYNKLTQTLDAESGKLDMGVAEGLYDLPKTKIKLEDCPIKSWFTQPGVFPQFTCQYTTAIPTPYIVGHWVKPGHTWLAVTVATNLALYAIGNLDGGVASYRVIDNKDLSTVNGDKSLGTLREKSEAGGATGTLVFDVKGKLPKTMHLLREYQLTLNGVNGKIDAPERRTVKIGGDVDLTY